MGLTRRSLIAAGAGGLLALAACSSNGTTAGSSSTSASSSGATSSGGTSGTITVVASTNVWGNIAGAIGGDLVAVTSLMSDPNQDPHEFQASSRNQLALSQAQVVIANGGGYDDFVTTMLEASGNTSAVVLNAVDISGYAATQGDSLNEHVWYDYTTVAKVAQAINDAFAKVKPDASSTFASNTAAFRSGLDKLDTQVAAAKATDAGKAIAITEPVPLYLTAAMGLVNKTPEEFSAAIENETDASVKVMQETLALFSDHTVAALVYNEQTTGAQTEQVVTAAKSNGVPIVPVQETLPDKLTYLEWQAGIITAITQALNA